MQVPKPIKKEKKKKRKASEYTIALQNADANFSLFIRLRAKTENNLRCVTCNNLTEFGTSNCQAGHYVSRKLHKYRFDERNVNIQCYACNIANYGALISYADFIKRKYGKETLEELDNYYKDWRHGKIIAKRYNIEELKSIELKYDNKIKELKND